VVSRRQLVEFGLSPTSIKRWVDAADRDAGDLLALLEATR
jgi:hypothetical protein